MELTVTDTGSGMDRETRERIFEPYFTSKDQDKGTGLGLSVVHGIVKSLGGFITVDSAPSQGSSFNILLPRIEKSDSQSVAQSAPLPTGTEHILVVDDEEAIVAFEKQSLERLGYTVTSETDSQKALEIFRADPDKFDLVITDMTMPRLNGAELTKELLAIHPETPIILCTGYSALISEQKAKGLGIKEFLMKPVYITSLAKTVRKVLDNKTR
jgi:CheY-like chemotaxis protein